MSSPKSGIGRGILEKDGRKLGQVQFAEANDSLCAAIHIQLAEDMLNMHLDRASGKKKFLGNRIIGKNFRDQVQHFEFPGES